MKKEEEEKKLQQNEGSIVYVERKETGVMKDFNYPRADREI